MSLAGRTIALAEGRQLEDLASLLEKEGATPLRYPLLSILDPVDDGPALAWMTELGAGALEWVVLYTGEGVRRLLTCAERHGRRDEFIASLGKARIVTRGPKPVRALAEIQVKPTKVASIPTTAGVIAALASESLAGVAVGVQLYREDNPPFFEFLAQRQAIVRPVLPYLYAPDSDSDRVADLIARLEQGSIDAVAFTSGPQVDRLFDVAAERGSSKVLRKALAKTKVAAVGPIVAENFRNRGVTVDICPEQGWVMKNLVQQMKKAFAESSAGPVASED